MDIVGRRRQVSEAKRHLLDTRLLTLTGVGGVGKTRLALRIAAEVRREFPDGVWFIELASLQNRDLLTRTVAMALSLPDGSARPPVETLTDYLRDKRLLLVLDNCEHLLDVCTALINSLLGAAPRLRILATSRECLDLPKEFVFVVPPLSVPRSDREATASGTSEYEATTLFVKRARLIMPEFTVDATNIVTVARLCRRLDGIPLAIELAAVRLRVLSLDQILERLDDRFRLLARRCRTTLPRQQTLRATVDWSFELCSVQEQALWARLSVFAGGMDLHAAEEVCSADPIARENVFDLVTALIEKSILTREGEGTQARYRLLETLRQYGEERLVESGAQAIFRRRHCDYYRDLAEQAKAGWFTPRQVEWFNKISQERANFRVALEYCVTAPGEERQALQLAVALYGFWVFYGAFGEARHWLDRALREERETSAERFKALAMDAVFALMQGEIDLARPLINECCDYARKSDDGRAGAVVAFLCGRAALLNGDYQGAVSKLKSALDWYQTNVDPVSENGDMNETFLTAFYLAIAASFLGDARSADFAAECRRLAETADALGEISMGMWVMGIERWRAGDTARAIVHFQESLRLDYAFGYRYSPAWSVETLAWATAAVGQHVRAACLLGVATELRSSMGLSLPGFRPYADSHNSCESYLREVLGDESYTENLQRGMSLGHDSAIDYALGKDKVAAQPLGSHETTPSKLTPRERQVADLVAEGMSNKDIAARLVIAQRTAEGHVENVLVKLGFTSRAQIAAWVTDRKEPR
jgi:predicted ATPase/DNA-binding CsgD family transcriptional regulator